MVSGGSRKPFITKIFADDGPQEVCRLLLCVPYLKSDCRKDADFRCQQFSAAAAMAHGAGSDTSRLRQGSKKDAPGYPV